jgi:hypothetical protein
MRTFAKRAMTLAGMAAGLALLGIATRAGEKQIADGDVAAWVDKRVRDWQPSADDRPFDQIGWVQGIREAERLAKQNNRPVFLFTHDGHIALGRC